ncbi:splicing factor 45-like isoform X2 [Halichondria panicea]|uniref:splicing factor 45-like isoform X2 n=1 Tax=Halichondria panicea TaxID=6063 RepID=UPI00312B5A0B
MSLYDGISVETAPVPEMAPAIGGTATENKSLSGWSSGLKLMASQIQRNKKALKATQQSSVLKARPTPGASANVISQQMAPPPPVVTMKDFIENDLAIELQDEYDPLAPNNYESIYQERKVKQEKVREEERKRRHEDRDQRRRRRRSDSDSDSDDDRKSQRSRRKDAAAIPPPASMAMPPPPTLSAPPAADQKQEGDKTIVVSSVLEELSKKKAPKVNPFGKPKFGNFASNFMSKYGWEEGQGLGKSSQGISTALTVEKTSKRGGKIVNTAAEQELQAEEEKKKEQSMVELLKNPTKVVLLQNMVGPGDVDEDLEPEVAEECAKYGEVERCLIFEIREGDISEEEAVRIFVQFARVESAIKAVVDLNGRFFGGRMVRGSFYSEDKFSNFDLAP